MTALPDARQLSPERRAAAAERVRAAADVSLPPLRYFNSSPCPRHEPELDPVCRECGIVLRSHQRVGAAWFYMAGRGILADSVGSGKTAQAAALLAMCKETGELGEHSRAVIICPAVAVLQWERQLRRLLPGLAIAAVTGGLTPQQRAVVYGYLWEILVISDRTFAPSRNRAGDVETLLQFPVGTVIADDVDALRTHKTQTAKAVKALAVQAARRYDLNAEPLQKRVMELHSHLEMVGASEVFGSPSSFRRNFVKTGTTQFYQRAMTCDTPLPCPEHPQGVARACRRCKTGHVWPQPARRCPQCGRPGWVDPTGRTVQRTVSTDIGVKNLEEFKWRLRPFVLRRTEFGGDGYPEVQPNEIWVDLNPAQRERYDELRRHKTVRRYLEAGEEVSQAKAAALFTRGAQICSGLATLDDGRDDSAKLDRLMRMLTGSLEDEKVVCFVYYKPNVAALAARLEAAGIGHVLMWSEETDAAVRDERVQRFTTDSGTRVLVGTTTIARSLDLQAARHLVAVDTVLNPKLMTQVVGRIKRRGSVWQTVFFHQFFARDTQEEGYLPLLQREQAISDSVWSESGDLFQGLSSGDMLRMIAYGEAA